MTIRLATEDDAQEIVRIDPIKNEDRKQEISEAIGASHLYVYIGKNLEIAGYVVFNKSFFHHYFISLVVVSEKFRKTGVAHSLIKFVMDLCCPDKLFTSTNHSNTPAQRLFEKCGFIRSGFIEGLEKDDPEIIYLKDFLIDRNVT